MIQNYLVFCIDGQAKYVQGSIPTGKLVANDINRNSIWVISPFYPTGIVRGSFQTKDRVIEQVSSVGVLMNDKISVDELVPKTASYYSLVKDWNVWEIKVPQRILSFLSHHRLSDIGISFEFKDYLVPPAPNGFNYIEQILEDDYVPNENGYYIVKIPQYEYDETLFHFNDILVKDGESIYVLRRIEFAGNTPTQNYKVDPAIPANNYEQVETTLTEDILATLQEHGISITNIENGKVLNPLQSNLDANGYKIINLQKGTSPNDAISLQNLLEYIDVESTTW